MILKWDRLDYDTLAKRTHLIGFDLDNTLANSRKPMLPDVADRFGELTRHIDVAVITGGRSPEGVGSWSSARSSTCSPRRHARATCISCPPAAPATTVG